MGLATTLFERRAEVGEGWRDLGGLEWAGGTVLNLDGLGWADGFGELWGAGKGLGRAGRIRTG